MIPHAAGPEGAGLDCISKKSNLTGAFETFSCNVSPGLFQIERKGKCQCRFLSAKSVKSALSVASCACQQDNCPLLLVFLDPFARIWKCFLTLSVHMFSPQGKDQRPQNKSLVCTSTFTCCQSGKVNFFSSLSVHQCRVRADTTGGPYQSSVV